VKVTDTGAGLDAAELKRIFKRFYRVPNFSTQKAKGTGLGLSIVQEIVKKHGGQITAESNGLGKGSAFTVLLPNL
jgi:signal transduction histidine kinase